MTASDEIRLAELMCAISVATDIGLGGPLEHVYLALLKTGGCIGDHKDVLTI